MIEAEFQIAQIQQATNIIVPVTYSSRMEDDGRIEPSRLSLLAYDVACYQALEQDTDLMVMAAEQSYRGSPLTTGDVLLPYRPQGMPESVVLHNPDNRLINTAYQTEALADVLIPGQWITFVGWEYHRDRLMDNLAAPELEAQYVTVDSVIDGLWKTAALWGGDHDAKRQAFASRYGFTVEWPEVRDRAIAAFAPREKGWMMRAAHKLSPRGTLLKKVSSHSNTGRLDDITPDGYAIMKKTV